MKKKDGDVIRLRRDLIVAYRYRKSGTSQVVPRPPGFTPYNKKSIFPDKKLTSKEFSYLLNNICGIPCSKADVDNGRKIKTFIKYTTPNTEVTRFKLLLVKQNIFPNLEIDDFLSEKSELTIDSVELDECILSQKMII